jgi:type I restriction enzyme, S subunit
VNTANLFTGVPQSWTVARLKRYLHVKSGDMLSAEDETADGIPVIGGNGIRGYTYKSNAKGPSLVIGRVGARCGCVHMIESEFWASEHAFVVYPRRNFNLRFVRYLLEILDFNNQAIRTAQPLINTEIVENTLGVFPPQREQDAIAAYLDRETSRIDALIAAKERLLDILNEKRRAIITHAVTHGLNPRASFRDSGISWLGKVPAHWETERTKWLFIERDERSGTGEEEMLTVSHITGVTPRSEKNVTMFEAESTEGYKVCYAGDLVINTLWAWMGAMGVSPMHGIVSPAYHVYTPCERLDPAYVDALVRIPVFADEVIRFSKGVWSSRLRLYPEGLYEIYLPVPPRDEQRAIVAHIASETMKLDDLRAATGQSIALSKERRAALIAAAVTGAIEVGGAA